MKGRKAGFLALVALVVWVGFAFGVYKTDWQYSASDLSGTKCIQKAIDDIYDWVSSIGLTNTTGNVTVSNLTVNGTMTGSVVSSNATGSLTTSNLTVNGSVSLPDASIASADLPATMSNTTLFSNQTAKAYMSNLVVKAGGSVSLPAASVATDALAAKTLLVGSVTCTIATNANGGTNVVTFAVKDLAGTTIPDYSAFWFYVADSRYGVPAAVAGDVVISGTGAAEIFQAVDKALYMVQASNGVAVATITDTPGGTNYIHTLSAGGIPTCIATSAFNVP